MSSYNNKWLDAKMLLLRMFKFLGRELLCVDVSFGKTDSTFEVIDKTIIVNTIFEEYDRIELAYLLLWILLVLEKLNFSGDTYRDIVYLIALKLYYNETVDNLFRTYGKECSIYYKLERYGLFSDIFRRYGIRQSDLLSLTIIEIYKLLKRFFDKYKEVIIIYYKEQDEKVLKVIEKEEFREFIKDACNFIREVDKHSLKVIKEVVQRVMQRGKGGGKEGETLVNEIKYDILEHEYEYIINKIRSMIIEGMQDVRYSIYKIRGRHAYYLLEQDIFPVLYSLDREDVYNLIVVLDTSGSITDEEYSFFITTIKKLLLTTQIRKVRVIMFSNNVTFDKVYDVEEMDKLLEELKKRRGYGGTVFSTVLKRLEKDENKIDKSVIIFTDGLFGDLEEVEEMKNVLSEYRRVLLITGERIPPLESLSNVVSVFL